MDYPAGLGFAPPMPTAAQALTPPPAAPALPACMEEVGGDAVSMAVGPGTPHDKLADPALPPGLRKGRGRLGRPRLGGMRAAKEPLKPLILALGLAILRSGLKRGFVPIDDLDGRGFVFNDQIGRFCV